MKQVTVIAPVKLTPAEIETLRTQLQLTAADHVVIEVNPAVIAGIKIVVDGKALDLTVKRQLTEIAGNN